MRRTLRRHYLQTFALSSAVMFTLAACDPQTPVANGDPAETINMALTTVPAGVVCVRITATSNSAPTTVKTFAVTAGSTSANLQIGPFPPGDYVVSSDAFTVACASIGTTVAPWIGDTTPVKLQAGVATTVTVIFRKNAPVTVNANFVNNVKGIALSSQSTYIVTDSGILQAGAVNNSKTFVRANFLAFDSSILPGNAVTAITSPNQGACAIRADGTVWCWGKNTTGELGPGIPVGNTAATPVQVPGLSNAKLISAGASHVCAHATYNSVMNVYCWGSNENGQLGDGTTTSKTTPVAALPSPKQNVKSLAAGGLSTYVLLPDGLTLWGWGANHYGQLNEGDIFQHTSIHTTPIQIWLPAPAQTIIGGGTFVLILAPAGKIYGAGLSMNGELGDGGRSQWNRLEDTGNGVVAAQLVAGASHGCALTSTSVQCWGYNGAGAVGNNGVIELDFTSSVPSPRPIAGLPASVSFTYLAAGPSAASTCGITTSQDVYCWGDNSYGQLGDGTINNAFAPIKPILQ